MILACRRHVCCQGHGSRSNVIVSYVKDSHSATALCCVVSRDSQKDANLCLQCVRRRLAAELHPDPVGELWGLFLKKGKKSRAEKKRKEGWEGRGGEDRGEFCISHYFRPCQYLSRNLESLTRNCQSRNFNHLKGSGGRWLHFEVFSAIQV